MRRRRRDGGRRAHHPAPHPSGPDPPAVGAVARTAAAALVAWLLFLAAAQALACAPARPAGARAEVFPLGARGLAGAGRHRVRHRPGERTGAGAGRDDRVRALRPSERRAGDRAPPNPAVLRLPLPRLTGLLGVTATGDAFNAPCSSRSRPCPPTRWSRWRRRRAPARRVPVPDRRDHRGDVPADRIVLPTP